MRNITLLLISSLFIITSCKTAAVTDFSKVKQLIETNTWYLQDEGATATGFNGQEISMKFRNENGLHVNGFAGCNNYNASVEILPDRIKFGNVMTTMMACPEMESEQAYIQLLELANGYEVSANEFRLYQDKILLIRFKTK